MLEIMTGSSIDPLVSGMTGGNPALGAPLLRAMLKAASLEGFIAVATSEGSEVFEAITLGFPSGVNLYCSEAQRAAGWDQFWTSLTPEHIAWWQNFQAQSRANKEKAMGNEVFVNSWYIDVLGTLPQYRKRGHATALMKFIKNEISENNKDATLSSDTPNRDVTLTTHRVPLVELYKKMGFVLLGEAEVNLGTVIMPDYYMIWPKSATV
ncbi:hypothetical protein C8R43DRAFT_256501 [Mycena crocata]|nr:hypothetical protein C8R43DRAFT_256501 [Mycena crocata]